MKDYKLHIPEGVKDYIGAEAARKEMIQNKVKEVFHSFSYDLIETPTFEYFDVFNVGEVSFQQPSLYHLINRQGEFMALRSDMTRAIARVVCTQENNALLPGRYAYMANSFRYPERYQGKMHEFTQAGVELIGKNSLEADAEVIKVAVAALEAVGLKDFTVHIGSSRFLEYMLKDLGLDEAFRTSIYLAIEQKDAVKLKKLLKEAAMDADTLDMILELTQCTGNITMLRTVKEKITSKAAKEALEDLEKLYNLLEEEGVSEYILFDFSIMSYGNYYTGMMFQIFTLGIGSAIGEGGRYDRLLNQFGRDLPAVGFGLHINFIMQRLIQDQPLENSATSRTLVVCERATRKVCVRVANNLRSQGLVIENSLFDTLEESLAYAKAAGFGGVLYFKSENEVEVHNIKAGTMDTTTVDAL